jgi:hypothetical protein
MAESKTANPHYFIEHVSKDGLDDRERQASVGNAVKSIEEGRADQVEDDTKVRFPFERAENRGDSPGMIGNKSQNTGFGVELGNGIGIRPRDFHCVPRGLAFVFVCQKNLMDLSEAAGPEVTFDQGHGLVRIEDSGSRKLELVTGSQGAMKGAPRRIIRSAGSANVQPGNVLNLARLSQ